MVEKKLFKKEKETNCDIMFLVQRKGKMRLMSFKCNPWLQFTELPNDADPEVVKHSLYLFSGLLMKQKPDEALATKFYRRFHSDKVQNV